MSQPYSHLRRILYLRRTTLALLLSMLVALAPPAPAHQQRRAETQRPARADAQQTQHSPALQQRPRLVLLIVVDQFRYDYLERFGDLFAANGLRRLQRDGASWMDANYDHVPTETAPGHATMLTGAWPAETGIISNIWHDRATNKSVDNVEDTSVRRLGGADPDPPSSPHNLLCSTVGDELKLATNNRSKVVGVSFKNRAAILPAGRSADAAYWFSTQTGEFVSSTYYFDQLPGWVARFDASRPADKFLGAKWERLLPAVEYESHAGRDDAPWEKGESNTHYTFPHVVGEGLTVPGPKFYEDLAYSPFTNDLLVSFAEAAIANEHLGEDADTDVLTVSFSSNDYVGHRYGPYSQELMDMTLRVDRQIGQLLDYVDAHVGLRNTVVVFTADHGVAPVPEHAETQRLPGGRVKVADVLAAVRNRLRAHFSKPGERDTTADYVEAFSNEEIYFNQFALERDGVRAEDAERVAGEAALTVPGIARFFTRTQLLTGAISPADATARRVLHGYNPARSGDVVIIPEAYKYLADGFIVATHGGPYTYDTHVPLIIMGGGLAPGRYLNTATPADIAPTLSRILNIQAPSNSMGRVLSEAMR
ncbi:MAG TPA: alkaline phosphatase family protein [Pyrinomonadaceae bacterium]|nr:alkaline phosphatase family protein [Pyrinomonadaceae bacterium]